MISRKIRPNLLLGCFVFVVVLPAFSQVVDPKRLARDVIADVAGGNLPKAMDDLARLLVERPDDLEILFAAAVAHSQKGNIPEAMRFVQEAVSKGLPLERFLVGPRDLLKPLTESREFQELCRQSEIRLIHGPMLGCVTPNSAKFWVRTLKESTVRVTVSESERMTLPIFSDEVRTTEKTEYTAVASVKGLRTNTDYFYEIEIDGIKEPGRWSFRTYPSEGTQAQFQIAFGGGAGYTPEHERMWNTVRSHELSAFLFLGDNVYIDHPTLPAVQQYCYYRRQSRTEFRAFTSCTGIYAIWDDHDFVANDGWGGPEIREPEWKIPVWYTFQNQWNNPAYGGGDESLPGCWFSFSIADVDFFLLDGRYYRTDPKQAHPSMLGPVQKEWLLKALKSSKGAFKVLASPVAWAFGTKPGSLDTWEGYPEEREEIFSFLEKNRMDGVILLSADRHRSDAWRIERPEGYRFYDFESSKLTNIHTHALIPGALFGYNDKCSFGLLTFDTTKEDPEVSYEIMSIDDELIHKITLKRSQISHPKAN